MQPLGCLERLLVHDLPSWGECLRKLSSSMMAGHPWIVEHGMCLSPGEVAEPLPCSSLPIKTLFTMSRTITVLVAFSLLLAFPVALADDDNAPEDPSQASTWGVCVADEANQQGDEDSNGTVSRTGPFNATSEEGCDEATAPWNGTAGDDHAPADPPHDGEDNPGDEKRDGEENSEDGAANGDDGRERGENARDEGSDQRSGNQP